MHNILVIRFSSIGDIVLTTPVLRCLKNQYPNSKIHFLTKAAFRSVVEFNPNIDVIHTLDESLLDTALKMRSLHFDFIIDLHSNLRSSVIKLFCQTSSFTFKKLNLEKWLLVNFKKNILPEKHIVERYMETVSELNVTYDGKGLDYFLPADISISQDLPNSYTVLVLGAQHGTKQFPLEKIKELIPQLHLPVVLIGGKDEAESGDKIALQYPSLTNLCGKLSIHQSAFVIKQAASVITNDTGMMHIAAAFQKPIDSIWGNTIPEFGMTPFYGEINRGVIHEVKNLSCRPCSKIGFKECPKQHFDCMYKQDTGAIALSVNHSMER